MTDWFGTSLSQAAAKPEPIEGTQRLQGDSPAPADDDAHEADDHDREARADTHGGEEHHERERHDLAREGAEELHF